MSLFNIFIALLTFNLILTSCSSEVGLSPDETNLHGGGETNQVAAYVDEREVEVREVEVKVKSSTDSQQLSTSDSEHKIKETLNDNSEIITSKAEEVSDSKLIDKVADQVEVVEVNPKTLTPTRKEVTSVALVSAKFEKLPGATRNGVNTCAKALGVDPSNVIEANYGQNKIEFDSTKALLLELNGNAGLYLENLSKIGVLGGVCIIGRGNSELYLNTSVPINSLYIQVVGNSYVHFSGTPIRSKIQADAKGYSIIEFTDSSSCPANSILKAIGASKISGC